MDRPLRRLNDLPPMKTNGNKTPKRTPAKPVAKENRWQTLNNFLDITMRDLTPAQTAVWLILFRDERKGIAKTAQSDIARRCGLSRESVSRAIVDLERRGLVQTVHQGGLNRGLSWYRVTALNKP